MERSTTQTNLQQLCGVSSVDHALSDDDLVFIDHHSLKRISLDETEPHIIQASLRANLNRRMKEYGRPTLAERILRQEDPIKYKDLTALNLLTSKPRTKKTLLKNITQSFSTHQEKLPNLVSEDMLKKGIRSIPNIFVLHRIMTCQKYDKHSIALIKYLTTQCMQIDFNSPFETLEGEYEDCARLLLTPSSNAEEIKQQMHCIKNLEGLHDIWEQQNPADWNQVLLQHTPQAPVPRFIGPEVAQVDEAQSLEKDSPSESEGITTIPALSPIEPKTSIQKGPEPLAQILTCTQEQAVRAMTPSILGTMEKGKDDNTDSTITKSDTASEPEAQQKEKPQPEEESGKQTETFTSPESQTIWYQFLPPQEEQADRLPGVHKLTKPDVRPKTQARDRSRVTGLSKGYEQKPSEAGQQPPAKEQSQRATFTPLSDIPEMGLDFTCEEDFNNHLAERTIELHNLFMQQEDDVLQYIKNPGNSEALKNALRAVNTGPWISSRLYTLLKQAADITPGDNNPFRFRLDALIKSNVFFNGQPPKELSTGKVFMHLEQNKKLDGTMLFYCPESIPSKEALGSYPKHFSVFDTNTASLLATSFAIYDYLGPLFFEEFGKIEYSTEMELVHGFCIGTFSQILTKNLKMQILAPARPTEIKPSKGSIFFATNHREYKNRHINHQEESLITICTSEKTQEPTFTVPGLFTGLNEDNVNNILVTLYNQEPATEKMVHTSLWNQIAQGKKGLFYGWNTPPGDMTTKKLKDDRGGLDVRYPSSINFEHLQVFKHKQLKEHRAKEKTRKKLQSKDKKNSTKITAEKKSRTKPSTPSTPDIAKIKRKTVRTSISQETLPEYKQPPDYSTTLLKKMQKKLHQLCQKRELQSVPEITTTANSISERMHEMEYQSLKIPDELKRQIDQDIRTAEEIRTLAPLETMLLELRNLCEKRKLHSIDKITEAENRTRALMHEMENKDIKIPDRLKRQIDQDCRTAQEIRVLAPLEQIQSKLHKLCEKRNLQSTDEITETENSTRTLMQEMENKDIKIPDELKSQLEKDYRVAEEMRELVPLAQMQRRLHKLWKEAKKNPERIPDIPATIDTIRTLITQLERQGIQIPEDVRSSIEKDIRDAEKIKR